MQDLWISSDHHIGHKNILRYCPDTRPFDSVEEMDEEIIRRHNSLVMPDDIFYMLGDFSFSNEKRTTDVLKRMNGEKHYIFGNHCKVMHGKGVVKQFEWMGKYKEIKVDKQDVILFHFPILEWNKCHRGSYHFFGHLHSNLVRGRSMDIGVDSNNLYPHNIRDLLEKLKDNDIEFYHKEDR